MQQSNFKLHHRIGWYGLRVLSVLMLLLISIFELHIYCTNNFSAIIPGKIYRSAQPSTLQFADYLRRYHIKTIINLRGNNQGSRWYDDEIQFATTYHLEHFDVKLKAYQLPSLHTLQYMVTLLKNAPQPILIHCRSGVDRTGLAAAMAIIIFSGNHQSINQAGKEVSWRYNVLSPKTVGYQVLANYLNYLHSYHLHHSQEVFLEWLYGHNQLVNDRGYFIL